MNQKLIVALAFAAGLLGGLLARYITPESAFAQIQAPPATKEIRAQEFTIVDPLNRVVGTFTFQPTAAPFEANGKTPPPVPRRIVLRDSSGREIWTASEGVFRPLTER